MFSYTQFDGALEKKGGQTSFGNVKIFGKIKTFWVCLSTRDGHSIIMNMYVPVFYVVQLDYGVMLMILCIKTQNVYGAITVNSYLFFFELMQDIFLLLVSLPIVYSFSHIPTIHVWYIANLKYKRKIFLILFYRIVLCIEGKTSMTTLQSQNIQS